MRLATRGGRTFVGLLHVICLVGMNHDNNNNNCLVQLLGSRQGEGSGNGKYQGFGVSLFEDEDSTCKGKTKQTAIAIVVS